jgi:hypothetical protein
MEKIKFIIDWIEEKLGHDFIARPSTLSYSRNCVGYFQKELKPFSCYVKISYATKVIE